MKRFNVGDCVLDIDSDELLKMIYYRDDGKCFLERCDGTFLALESNRLALADFSIHFPFLGKGSLVKVLCPHVLDYGKIVPVIDVSEETVSVLGSRDSFPLSICLVQVYES